MPHMHLRVVDEGGVGSVAIHLHQVRLHYISVIITFHPSVYGISYVLSYAWCDTDIMCLMT